MGNIILSRFHTVRDRFRLRPGGDQAGGGRRERLNYFVINFLRRADSMLGGTKLERSPPHVAISRTRVADTNVFFSSGIRKTVSTSGASLRLASAMRNSYSKSATCLIPLISTEAFFCLA